MATNIRKILDKAGFTTGTKIPEDAIKDMFKNPRRIWSVFEEYPPTPFQVLNGRRFLSGAPTGDSGDYSKQIAVLNSDGSIAFTYSSGASIGVCQIQSGKYKGKFVAVFKNKPLLQGVALPGGTAGNSNQEAKKVYDGALIREFKEECGITLSAIEPIMVANPTPRLVHSCVVYICKGNITNTQREKDVDLSIAYLTWDELKIALSSELSIDPWITPYIQTNEKELRRYFHV